MTMVPSVEPNSALLVLALFAGAIGSLVVLVRFANIFARIGTAVLALTLATVGGMAVVNDYYGYYQTWGQLSADLTGSYAQFTSTAIGNRNNPELTGKVISVSLPGAASGIDRSDTCTCRPSTSSAPTRTRDSLLSNCCTARPAMPRRGWCTCA